MKKSFVALLIFAFIISGSGWRLPCSISYAKQTEETDRETGETVPLAEESKEVTDENEAANAQLEGSGAAESDFDEGEVNSTSQKESEEETGNSESAEVSAAEMMVPIYNYEIDNVVVPTTYAMSLNPYKMPIKVGEDEISSEQVLSRKYGIINKSSMDKVVTITFVVEDLNDDKITFVDSAEAAKNAGEDVYAVYLALLPADGGEIKIGGADMDKDTSASELSDVEMTGAKDHAVVLHTGENKVSFRLSKAVYEFEGGIPSVSDEKPAGDAEKVIKLDGLSPDGKSATAFTFDGAMNSKAEWGKLLKGIRVTAVYDYQNADGTEKIIDGTGALIAVN